MKFCVNFREKFGNILIFSQNFENKFKEVRRKFGLSFDGNRKLEKFCDELSKKNLEDFIKIRMRFEKILRKFEGNKGEIL